MSDTTPKKIRVLLADDHATLREALAALLRAQPDIEVVGEAAAGDAAVSLAGVLQPDVVVLDLSMPRMTGVQAIPAVKVAAPDASIVILTRHDDYRYVQQCLQAGVSGYVSKVSSATELLHAIRVVSTGRSYLDPRITEQVVHHAVRADAKRSGQSAEALTERETEVLRLVARGYSSREAAGALDISVKTVEAHKAHAQAKLGVQSRADLIRFAALLGWLFDL